MSKALNPEKTFSRRGWEKFGYPLLVLINDYTHDQLKALTPDQLANACWTVSNMFKSKVLVKEDIPWPILHKIYAKYRLVLEPPSSVAKAKTIVPEGQQVEACEKMFKWARSGAKTPFKLFGYAGTGKSSLAFYMARELNMDITWMAPTGKAAMELANKGVMAKTYHSTCYLVEQDEDTGVRSYSLRPSLEATLLGLDEVSMVNDDAIEDLMSFEIPLFTMGDPGQLPPPEGSSSFMDQPDVMLTEIRRQAKDNPILQLATKARLGEEIKIGTYGNSAVHSRKWLSKRLDDFLYDFATSKDSMIACGRNATRIELNNQTRSLLEYEGLPQYGESLMCLKNARDIHPMVVNGSMWKVLWCSRPYTKTQTYTQTRNGRTYRMASTWRDNEPGEKGKDVTVQVVDLIVKSTDSPSEPSMLLTVPTACFEGTQELHWKQETGMTKFTWGYVGTGHKLQGAQYNRLLVLDEAACFREHESRWRYTTFTRAIEQLISVNYF